MPERNSAARIARAIARVCIAMGRYAVAVFRSALRNHGVVCSSQTCETCREWCMDTESYTCVKCGHKEHHGYCDVSDFDADDDNADSAKFYTPHNSMCLQVPSKWCAKMAEKSNADTHGRTENE